jgi:hypothetical protein
LKCGFWWWKWTTWCRIYITSYSINGNVNLNTEL